MMRMMGWISLLLAMVAMALALPDRTSLSALLPTIRLDPPAAGPLLPCGTSGDPIQDQIQVVHAFGFVRGVCEQRGESFLSAAPLPTSCGSAECQRVVQLVEDSCGPALILILILFRPMPDQDSPDQDS